jgi:hypothetical protein
MEVSKVPAKDNNITPDQHIFDSQHHENLA